jgi:hypothetical protein
LADNVVSLVFGRRPINVRNLHAGTPHLIFDVATVTDRRGEDNRAAPIGMPKPVGDNVTNKLGGVHALRKLPLDIITSLGANPLQVRRRWRVNLGADEIAEADQLLDLRRLDQHVEDVAETTPITPAWRSGQANDPSIRVALDDLLVGPRPNMVSFVNEDDIGRR